jgi:hypothetical protein
MSPEPSDPFYVGYNARMPATFARRVRGAAAALLALAVLLPLLLIAAQGRFSSGAFEFDRTRVLEGRLAEFPYPALDVDADGAPPASYWLVGPGKHGAAALVRGLDGRRVRVRGSLIERDGEKMLQLVPGEIEIVGAPAATKPSSIVRIRTVTVVGELVDSKCHLGVMKPGEGPAHRDCAVRCLLGAVPPMISVRNAPDVPSRLALVREDGGPLFSDFSALAGRPLAIRGTLVGQGSRRFLAANVDDAKMIR